MSRPRQKAGREHGTTMVEVLVGIVIIAFGLLALVGLQLVSKRNALDANQQTLAAQATHDLFERMRANSSPEALETYLFAASSGIGRGQQGTAPSPDCAQAGVTCSPREMAAYDVWAWEQRFDGNSEFIGTADGNEQVGGLVNPEVCLLGPPGGGTGVYRLAIAWRGSVSIPDDEDPNNPRCGSGLGLYGDNERFRRLLNLETYIVARR